MIHSRGGKDDDFFLVAKVFRAQGSFDLFYRIHLHPKPSDGSDPEIEVEEFFATGSKTKDTSQKNTVPVKRKTEDFWTFEHRLTHRNLKFIRVFISWKGEKGKRELTDRFHFGHKAPLGAARTDPTDIFVLQPSRLRLSVWCARNNILGPGGTPKLFKPVIDALVNASAGHVDDISLIDTFENTTNMESVGLNPVRVPAPPSKQQDLTRDATRHLIRECRKKKIQVLVGFAVVADKRGTTDRAFKDWIHDTLSTPTPTPEEFAKILVDAVMKEFPDCDGISFDIENLFIGKAPPNIEKARDRLTRFYQTVAGELRKAGPNQHPGGRATPRIAAVLVAAKSDDVGHFGHDGQGKLQPGNPGNIRTVSDYEIFKGNPNLILRPMAYDYFTGSATKLSNYIDGFHNDVMEYALNQKNVPPSQFQLGIKIGKPGETPSPEVFQQASGVIRRCEGLCQKFSSGIVLFAAPVFKKSWKDFDKALNEHATSTMKKGEPLQVPVS